jgi:predicted RNA-binding Zn ribbon-like protein
MVVMDELADQYPALNGGALCLDFANTFEPQAADGADRDHLGTDKRTPDAEGLVAWLQYARITDRPMTPSADVLRTALQLRSAVYDAFTAIAEGTEPSPRATAVLRKAYARAVSAADLSPGTPGWHWSWSMDQDPADALHPITASAIELLTGPELSRVKQCAGDRCWVLFIDSSKNGSRRWCQMRYCGNVLKSRRQAARRRAARATSS